MHCFCSKCLAGIPRNILPVYVTKKDENRPQEEIAPFIARGGQADGVSGGVYFLIAGMASTICPKGFSDNKTKFL